MEICWTYQYLRTEPSQVRSRVGDPFKCNKTKMGYE